MSVLIQFRRGNAAAVPSLNIAEPGWSLDTKVFNIGDGSSSPPQIATTKSTGSFNYPNVTNFQFPKLIMGSGLVAAPSLNFSTVDVGTGIYSPNSGQISITSSGNDRLIISSTGIAVSGNIVMSNSGTVDTVSISTLNPTGVNGIIVKSSDNTYNMRNLVPGSGIAPMLNSSGAANPGGASGDIIISIATNPTVPGNAAIKIPAGAVADRSGVVAVDGHFRYNTDNKYFEGHIDGEWRPFVDYVTGHTAQVPAQFSDIQSAINYYQTRSTSSTVVVSLAAGTFVVASTLSPGSTTNHVFIQGQAPVTVALAATPIGSVTGSAGNWAVQYKLSGPPPANISTGMCIVVYQLYGSGDVPVYDWSNTQGVSVLSGNLSQVTATSSSYNLSTVYNVNDYILHSPGIALPQLRKIQSVVSNTILGVSAPFTSASQNKIYHRRLLALAGTITATGSTTITGSGTTFTTSLNVGDYLFSVTTNQIMQVLAIASNTSLTVSNAVTITAETVCQIINSEMHKGCWKITNLDTINNIVTVANTSNSPFPPPVYGILSGTVAFMPSSINFTTQTLMTVTDTQFIGFSNLTASYTGSSPTQGNYVVYSNGGDVQFTGLVGCNNGSVYGLNETSITFQRLFISGGQCTTLAGLNLQYGSNFTGQQLVVTGNSYHGVNINQAEMYASYGIVSSGNIGYGLVATNSEGWLGIAGSVSNNQSSGLYIQASDLAGNAFACNGNSSGSNSASVYGLNISRSSSWASWDLGWVLGTVGATGLVVQQNSYVNTTSVVYGANGGSGVGAYSAAIFDANSIIITNSINDGMEIRYASSSFFNNNSVVSNNAQHGAYVAENSFLYASNSVLTRGNSTYFDVQVFNSSNAFLLNCTGSGTSGAFNSSPGINGVPGNRNSSVYTQAEA